MAHGLIDTHCHLWDLAQTPQEWIDPTTMASIDRDFRTPDLDAVLSVHDVDFAVLVQANNTLAETRFLLDESVRSDKSHAVVGWVDLTTEIEPQLASFTDHAAVDRLVGVRHLSHVDPDPAWLERPDVTRGVQALAAAGLSMDLVVRAHQLPHAIALADAVPDAQFILNHLGNPPIGTPEFPSWESNISLLAERPNVVAKLSGLAIGTEPGAQGDDPLTEISDVALATFGPSRLMFGSDWPLVRMSTGSYAAWLARITRAIEPLSPSEQLLVRADTALTAYRKHT